MEGLEGLFLVLVARDLGVLLPSLCHELCEVVFFCLGDGFRLWERDKSSNENRQG